MGTTPLSATPQGCWSCLALTSPPPLSPPHPTGLLGGSSPLLGRPGPHQCPAGTLVVGRHELCIFPHRHLDSNPLYFFFFLKEFLYFYFLFIYLFIFGCVGSPSLRESPLQLRQAGATLHRGARASHHRGLSCYGAQAPDAQAQQSWFTGPAAPRHVGSSQTRARTCVPRIGRQTPNHCATREAPLCIFLKIDPMIGCLLEIYFHFKYAQRLRVKI